MRKNPWLENSKKNIIPLSSSKEFKEALKEWDFSGEVIDHGAPIETCELCEHEELRYHYEIENAEKKNRLWVGSSCILRFQEINVYGDKGVQLTDQTQRQQALNKALNEKRVDLALQPLRTLWRKDKDYRIYIENCVTHFKLKEAFEPKGLSILCARMKNYEIDYDPKLFPVYLRSIKSKYELSRLEGQLLEYVKRCMSPQQIKRFGLKKT